MLKNQGSKRIASIAIAIGLVGCSAPSTPNAQTEKGNRPLVIATHSILCDLTKQIAANTVDLKCLVQAGTDPHVYQATPEDRKAIEQAKLILYGGYNFEPSLIKLIQATSNPAPKVAVDEIAVPNPEKLEEDGETVTDPHVWHNAQNGIQMAKVISDRLSQLQPEQAKLYAENTNKITSELTQIDTWIKSQIATIPPESRQLVTTHDALGYYSKAYEIPVIGALEGISTDEAPTAARVSALVKDIKKAKVPTIFAEATLNPKLIQSVAREAKVKVSDQELYADGLGETGSEGETYQKMLTANTCAIVDGLGGKCTPLN
ncbi:MAG TPA: metal ABC transporter substrate-binding protein [Cyanobacteria bacterium UBA11369]|nr:metal ABC transporter substrate-binding protein [Cyanobacteria bacterium UBA11368]HBE49820.1 metal ABC transporter substrate-binding protein [Cyanobacteria bacterium UBA11369]